MSKIQKPEKPAELPLPDKEPEIKPAPPGEPLVPDVVPEISPKVDPEEPKYV
jgi:hypothetical protein